MKPVPYNNFLNKINVYRKMKKTLPLDKNLTNYE